MAQRKRIKGQTAIYKTLHKKKAINKTKTKQKQSKKQRKKHKQTQTNKQTNKQTDKRQKRKLEHNSGTPQGEAVPALIVVGLP